MIRQIAPQFFTMDIGATLAYYKEKLGFDCVGTWDDPPVYAIVARDEHRIHFRCAEPPAPNPDKYAEGYRRNAAILARVCAGPAACKRNTVCS